jgi:hypothetical protein
MMIENKFANTRRDCVGFYLLNASTNGKCKKRVNHGGMNSNLQKNCLINELYRFEFFSELLVDMGAEIALALP